MATYEGVVEGGGKLAGALGFPTANIALRDSVSGIFAAKVMVDGTAYEAVAYADQKRKILEAHLFHFSGDLYKQTITIDLLKKIRDDAVFTDEAQAKEQIAADMEAARDYFAA